MKRTVAAIACLVCLASLPRPSGGEEGGAPAEAQAAYQEMRERFGFVPSFVREFPPEGVAGAWEAWKALELEPGPIPDKFRSLISLAVSAQIPCSYCVYWDTRGAEMGGATHGQLREALAMAAITRHWSTVLNGMQIDDAQFRREVDQVLAYVGRARQPVAGTMRPVVDAESAYADIQRTLGSVPTFLREYPRVAIAGAWRELKGIQLDPDTEIPGKYKELIGLAVAAQVPCDYCTYFHTRAARQAGASDEEVRHAVALSALTRHWSTVLNGLQMEEAEFRREADRMLRSVSAAPPRPGKPAPRRK